MPSSTAENRRPLPCPPYELLLLVLFGVGNYLLPLTALPLRGEETRRALLAREMVETGNWVTLQEQRQPFLESSPLFYWTIAASAQLHGEFTRWSVRLPSALATILTMLVIYAYGRVAMTRLGAFAAALSFGTMISILDTGVIAEMEAVFAFFIASSLLLWHLGYLRGWHPATVWSIGYGLAALGMLAKGLQAPVYFVGGVGMYLLLRRDWRWLLHWGHALGMTAFWLVLAAWFVPLYRMEGWEGVRFVLFDRSTSAFGFDLAKFAVHLVEYPLEHLLNMLPASVALLAFLSPRVRGGIGSSWPGVMFCLVCIAVAFPTCWFAAGAAPRYFRPLYACVAVLIGVAIERLAAEETMWVHVRRTAWMLGTVMLGAGIGVGVIAGANVLPERLVPPPIWMAVTYGLLMAVLATTLFVVVRERSSTRLLVAVSIPSLFVAITGHTIVDHLLGHLLRNVEVDVARIESMIPEGETLVSYGPVLHRFTYAYREPIPIREDFEFAEGEESDVNWFCYDIRWAPPDLPFAWERVTAVVTDRNRKTDPADVDHWIVIGRRIPDDRIAAEPKLTR